MAKPLLCELSVHLTSEWRGRLLRTCVTLIDRLNPGLDYLLIDNASPIDPLEWVPGRWTDMGKCLSSDGPIPVLRTGVEHIHQENDPSVYVLMHMPSGHFYIGSTFNPVFRGTQWANDLYAASQWCPGGVWRPGSQIPKRFFDFSWLPREWTVRILCKMPPSTTSDQLAEKETEEITRALISNPRFCLNAQKSARRPHRGHRWIARFPDAIGHFHHNKTDDPPPRDGPGRSNMTSLLIAYASGYERSVYQETDCLFVEPYEKGFSQLTKKVGCQDRCSQNYLDWNIWYKADLPWLRDFQFVEKYDWPNRKGDHYGEPVGEFLYEHILGEHLQVLPMRGCRAGMEGVTAENLRERFPDGIEWITHADQAGFEEFLRYTAFDDLIPMLQGQE